MAVRVNSGVNFGPTGTKIRAFVDKWYPYTSELYITSSYRATEADGGTWSHHNGQTYNGSPTAAVDYAAPMTDAGRRSMQKFARWMYDNFGDLTVEMLHSTPFSDDNGFLVRNQQKMSLAYPEHNDHVHYATSAALVDQMEARAVKFWGQPSTPGTTPPVSTDCFGWDASNHDWGRGEMDISAAVRDGIKFFTHKASEGVDGWYVDPYYKRALDKAKAAGMPIMGAYFVLHPGNAELQAEQFFQKVNTETPWWKDVPWIWQLDAEKFEYMTRAPNLDECNRFMDRLHALANGHGYFTVYAPKWLYGDTLRGLKYDLWASNYTGSGTPANYKTQWVQVEGSSNPKFAAYSGKEPLILQYSSDATIGTQRICDANKFRGTFQELLALAGGGSTNPPVTPPPTGSNMSVLDAVLGQGPEKTPLPDDFEYGEQMASTAIAWTWVGVDKANAKLDQILAKLEGIETGTGLSEDELRAMIREEVKKALREGTD